MSMSFWVIFSWVLVAILTTVNVVIFLKLKQASEQMLKMAFPQAKNMTEAMNSMQKMMGGLQGMGGLGAMGGKGGFPGMGAMGRPGARPSGPGGSDAQLKAAMEMLNKMKK